MSCPMASAALPACDATSSRATANSAVASAMYLDLLSPAAAGRLCLPPLEHPERDGEQDCGEHHENTGLDALECPEPAGWLVGHVPPVAVRHQAGQGIGFEA